MCFIGLLDVTVDVHPEKAEFKDFVTRVEAFKGSSTDSPNYEVMDSSALLIAFPCLHCAVTNSLAGGDRGTV